jgi:ABC-type dipeptide/oligopeptide/nickel transport system permease component/ABC-type transport system substrate-binding protein
MKLRSVSASLVGLVAAFVGLAILIVLMGLMVRPDMTAEPVSYPRDEVDAVRQSRQIKIDPDVPVRLVKEVDYSEGPSGLWYPKGESPMLADLVAKGELPPVAERVGSEPAVVEGPDGIGQYGGSWIRMSGPSRTLSVVGCRLSYITLVRFGPHGYPLVPFVAKSYDVSPDNRQFTFHLRKGMKWSDGYPFTADDIIYWWRHEVNDPRVKREPVPCMRIKGKLGDITKLDDYSVRFSFPEPYGAFLAKLASFEGEIMLGSPEHYLRQFHPALGDKDRIKRWKEARKLNSDEDVYLDVCDEQNAMNPDYPRLWPWVYRTYRSSPPQVLVRNPYYFAVDPRGNQLPYIDRLVFEVKSDKMSMEAISNGEASMQARGIKWDRYTMMMQKRREGHFHVLHWYPGDRSDFCIYPNLNRTTLDADGRVDSDAAEKHKLLNDKRFRQALSLAIDREEIIRADYDNVTVAAQAAPGPASYFYDDKLYKAYTQFDPGRANELLDEIGLTERDLEGYRELPNGDDMTFLMNFTAFTGIGPAQFIVDDWARVGVRLVIRELANNLYYAEKNARTPDFTVWSSNGEFFPLIEPRVFVPYSEESNFAQGWAMWYNKGGPYGNPEADPARTPGSVAPPPDSPMRQAIVAYEKAIGESDPVRQREAFRVCQDIAAENLWTINVCTPPPVVAVVRDGLMNVPKTLVYSWDFQSPGNGAIEAWYFDLANYPDLANTPETTAATEKEVMQSTPAPDVPRFAESAPPSEASAAASDEAAAAGPAEAVASDASDASPQAVAAAGSPAPPAPGGRSVGRIVKYSLLAVVCLLVLMAAVRHPYIGRRLLIMIPTLAIISVVSFVIIRLPPGNYVATMIMQLRQSGDQASETQIRSLQTLFFLKEYAKPGDEEFARKYPNGRDISGVEQYARWMGLYWFATRNPQDEGLLQGYLGRSMESQESVNLLIGDRLLLTILISLGTIMFTWALAIPTGIYSAVRQYSIGDYVLTFVGFIGMCIPGFLLALLLMYFSTRVLGEPVSGLFSSRYGSQVGWDWAKFVDLMKHIWIPVVVLGVGETAWMIRVMRANLLDELRKPYVTTALAKGVRPMKLLFKYPVRIALNPFISGLGGLFPEIISGGAIVAIVLSLPTIGPKMLDALMAEDMYFAGSLLMILSLLAVVGTLVSDLLLLWLDPRIRMQGGTR